MTTGGGRYTGRPVHQSHLTDIFSNMGRPRSKSWLHFLVLFSIVLFISIHATQGDIQDDSDLVFDDEILGDSSEVNVVKRAAPAALDVDESPVKSKRKNWKPTTNVVTPFKKGHKKKLPLVKSKASVVSSKQPLAKIIDDEDMLADSSGSGNGQPTPSLPQPRKAFRCTLMIQEPFTVSLTDRDSVDFENLSLRFSNAVEEIYEPIPGLQTVAVLNFSQTTDARYTKCNFDITSQNFFDEKLLEQTLLIKVKSGRVGDFYVKSEGFSWRSITGAPVPVCPEATCRSGECISFADRCNYVADCEDGSDEDGCPVNVVEPCEFNCASGGCYTREDKCDGKSDCRDGTDEENCPAVIPLPPIEPPVDDCRGDIKFKCRGGTKLICEVQQCDGTVDCPEGDDEEGCPTSSTSTSTSTTTVPSCGENEMLCDNTRCIPVSKVCDQVQDCSDGTDEQNCIIECRQDEFRCNNNRCIPIQQRCDKTPHCSNGEDENDCPCDGFECADGTCIAASKKCDGRAECLDFSDELNCGPAGESCSPGEFRCKDETCVAIQKRCDGVPNCRDGSDEMGCPCNQNQWQCDFGTCIDGRLRCDGKVDCPGDISDERDCPVGCSSNQLTCSDGSCIDLRLQCDGVNDCRDGSDERGCVIGCSSNQLTCSDGSCVDIRRKCDGVNDCRDGSDERGCACTQNQFRCNDGTCIDNRRKCDTRRDCPDGSDEFNCDCRPNEFRCGSGQCIESSKRCDRIVDCPDRSDENNCGLQCSAGQFLCASGTQCIADTLVCDGKRDCPDFSDEAQCPSPDGELNLKTYPSEETILQGREVVFQCRDEGPLRAPVRWVRGSGLALPPGTRDLNGRLEMPNIQLEHTGTYICEAVGYPATKPGARVSVYLRVEPAVEPPTRPPAACGVNEATCMNGDCIPKTAVCDGDFDCSDSSDEMRCSSGCEPNEYRCENKRCVLKTWRCDGDDDCGDNSDEKYCKPNPPGSSCRYNEFQCKSQDQCIPKSFHCDMELDCLDRSDEIGCSKPSILIPPPTMLMVNTGTSIVINCTAVGVPTPEVVWRLNWGHVPSKCTMTSENGYGVLTCPNAQTSDQGAYSCEAINAKGSTFAVPDCIVVIKPLADICIDEEFNSGATSPADCIPCFCFGQTNECSSSSLYLTQLPPPTDQFQLITLRNELLRRQIALPSSVELNAIAVSTRSFLRTATSNDGVQVYRRDASSRDIAYFNLPPSHRGNQLRSYGGYIRYRLLYRGSGVPIGTADIIISGNGVVLYHELRNRLQANQQNEVSVRFWPTEWLKGDNREPAKREDLMMVLQNLEYLLIRATYLEGALDTTITQIRMDTAIEQNYNQGQANLIEECRCPPGYVGLSCESCAPGYVREESGSGRWLGRCVQQQVCDERLEWTCGDGTCIDIRRRCNNYPDCRDRSDEADCVRPPTCTPNLQWTCDGSTCIDIRRRCDGRFDCQDRSDEAQCPTRPLCTPNLQWTCGDSTCIDIRRRCDGRFDCQDRSDEAQCPTRPLCTPNLQWTCDDSTCIDIRRRCDGRFDCQDRSDEAQCPTRPPQCNPAGTSSRTSSGCVCKDSVIGQQCDQCKPNSFFLDSGNQDGCLDCFCMGITKTCTHSNWYRQQERAIFTTDTLGFSLTDKGQRETITDRISVNTANREIVYLDFNRLSSEVYYWKLPPKFLGNKVTSYGGVLNYTVRYVPPPGGRSSPNNAPDVDLRGNGIRLLYYRREPIEASRPVSVSVTITEQNWQREDGRAVDRPHLLMALADLDFILIKATYTTRTQEAALSEVSLDIAEERNTGQVQALSVEKCTCPRGYKGLSCEDCDFGYTRSNQGVYLGLCEPCNCNGHSDECDPDTGICLNCRDHTTGDECDQCENGYNGDATQGTPNDCRPDTGRPLPCSCDPRGSLRPDCIGGRSCTCKANVEGANCDRCREGTFALMEQNSQGCLSCFCSGVTRQCSSGNLYRTQIPMQVIDSQHGFTINDRTGPISTATLNVNVGQNELSYNFPSTPGRSSRLYWSLSQMFTGNKVTSYGGKLSITQRYEERSGSGERFTDSDVILTGQGLTLAFVNPNQLLPSQTVTYTVPLRENVWRRLDRGVASSNPVTREDMMRVLSNIESIQIRATFSSNMAATHLSNVFMDTTVSQNTGQEQPRDVEKCVCPEGYRGTSCEECESGYYRDRTVGLYGVCRRCPCNNNEESCIQQSDNRVICNCRQGFSGRTCETEVQPTPPGPPPPTIILSVTEPRIQIAEIGSTVRFHCSGQSLIGRQVLLQWSKESGELPPGRSLDDRRGVLIIRDVRSSDSGTYICSALDGINTVTETVVLNVGGQGPSAPKVSIEPRFIDAQLGQYVEARCIVDGNPRPSVRWLNAQEAALSSEIATTDGVLKIASVRKSDEGEYICSATNPSGTSTARLTIFVRGTAPVQPEVSVQVVITPQDTTARRGDSVRLTCRAEFRGPGDRVPPTIRWSKVEGSLPVNAAQTGGVLTIPSASPADSGIYICTIVTASGSTQQGQARVTVLPFKGPPSVRIEPDRQTISQGTSAELRCQAVGDPSPTIRWSKVGEDFSSNIQATGPILRIVNAMVRDRGMYICTAENPGGSAQASAIIEVERREPPAVELYPQARQVITLGSSALFQCRVTAGIPSPRVKWSRVDGRQLSSNVEELDGGVVRFNRVTGNEQGQYLCTAENDAGTITAIATLAVQSIPVISITPSGGTIRAKAGQRLRLECRAQGDPVPTISWRRLRTGFLFDSVDAKESQQVAIYEITRVTQADEGTYSCTARNEAGLTEERVQITVESSSGRGDIEEVDVDSGSNNGGGNIHIEDVFRVPVGGTAEMRCILTGPAQGIYLDWVRSDGGEMPPNRDIRDGVLFIRDVTPEAAGEYSCVGVSATANELFSASTRLEVVAPPRIQLNPQRQVVRPGDVVYITCSATGDQPITINWSKIDGSLPPAVVVNNGQLQFRGIAVSDAGRYMCSASNSVGQADAVAEVIVNEERIISGSQREQTVKVGSNVDISCNLPPSVTNYRVKWSRDRGDLPPTSFTSRSTLTLTNVQPGDAGRYICEVSSDKGISTDYVLLKIERAPTLAVRVIPNREGVRRGDNLEIRCDVSGDPSALISWKRVGGSFSRNVQALGGLLRITDVKPENGGVYRCQVLSTLGTFDENYVLSIQADPDFPLDAATVETRNAPVRSVVVMDCRTDLRPPVKFTWSRQGGLLPKSARVEDARLSIPEVRAEDAGIYICTAQNADETMDIPTVLVVTGVVPYFAQAPLSYMQLPTLPDAYTQFDIEISFKPESSDGLIIYNGQQAGGGGDFISFGLNNGHPEFRFDVGAGPAIIRSDKPLELGKWHTVKLSRNRKDGTMVVDNGNPLSGSVSGIFAGLDLLEPLYIGGVPNFRSINKQAGFSRGFVGCISRLIVGNSAHELVRDSTNTRGITTCETCVQSLCENGGICQEAYSEQGYSCICPSGFSGLHCEQIGETCYPGACGTGRCVNTAGGFECFCPFGKSGVNCEKDIAIYEPAFSEGAYVAYPSPPKAALKKMRMAMRVKANEIKDSLLLYCSQSEEGQGDFTSLSIRDKHIEFRFDSGSGPAILKSDKEIRAGEWVHITADRNLKDGTLIINEGQKIRGRSPGVTRGLNLNTKLYVGGWDKQRVRLNPAVNVSSAFDGCLSHIEVQGMQIDLVNSVVDSANVEDCGGASACERKPCLNGGFCTETGAGLGDFECQCEEGFSGKTCEIEEDLCQVIRPCQNGGTCIGTPNAYKCNCPLGYGGTNCEQRVDVAEEAYFQGDSYVEIDKSLLPHTSPTVTEVITVEFSTLEANGILLWHGQKPETDAKGQDFIALSVVDGRLEFSFELGSGTAQISPPVRVDDGRRHRVVAKRTAREGTLELDGVIQENGKSPEGNHQMLNTKGNIFIGGLPNSELMTGGRYIHGLKGCIHSLQIQDSGILNFQRAAVSAVNVIPCSSQQLQQLVPEDDDYELPAN